MTENSFLNNDFVSILKSKLGTARMTIADKNDIYVDNDHKNLCKAYKVYTDLRKQIVVEETKTQLTFFKYNIFENKVVKTKKTSDIILHYNEYNKKFVNNLNSSLNINDIQNMIDLQSEFIDSLSMEDLYNLKYYTYYGDTILNAYIQKKFNVDDVELHVKPSRSDKGVFDPYIVFFNQFRKVFQEKHMSDEELTKYILENYTSFSFDIYEKVIKMYVSDLIAIFQKAPTNKTEFYVYRGFYDNYLSKGSSIRFNGNLNIKNGEIFNKRFMSTSLFPKVATGFTKKNGYIQRIKIKEGAKFLFLELITLNSSEYEILLPIFSKFFIDYPFRQIKTYFKTDKDIICDSETTEEYNVMDLTLLSV